MVVNSYNYLHSHPTESDIPVNLAQKELRWKRQSPNSTLSTETTDTDHEKTLTIELEAGTFRIKLRKVTNMFANCNALVGGGLSGGRNRIKEHSMLLHSRIKNLRTNCFSVFIT